MLNKKFFNESCIGIVNSNFQIFLEAGVPVNMIKKPPKTAHEGITPLLPTAMCSDFEDVSSFLVFNLILDSNKILLYGHDDAKADPLGAFCSIAL